MQFLIVLNILALIFTANIAKAESPVIWSSDFAKSLAPSGFEHDSGRQLRDCGSTVPSSGGGLSAPIGSICQYSSGALGALYLKVGGADTAWTDVLASTTGWALAGNAGTTAGTDFVGTTDAQDLVIKRNNVEIARAQSSGWQAATVLGSSTASGDLTLRSTSNATVGNILIGDQTGENTVIGPTGSATTPLYPAAVLTPTTQALTNAFVIHENSADMPNGRNVAGPQGWQFITKDIDGAARMFTRVNGFDVGEWTVYRASDGTNLGQMDFGSAWGIRSTRESVTALRVSGFGTFTANIQEWYASTAYSNLVASVGSGGQFRGAAGTVSLPGFAFQGDTNNGWWAPAADTQAWSLAGSEEMRLDSTGLGIDTSTPTQKLDVNGGARIRALTTAGPVKTDTTGVLSQSAVNLSTEVTGTLPVGNGGTGATTFTANLPLIGNGTGAIAQGTRSGNTTSFATTSGTLTSGNCVQFDASGNLVDSGAACGGGSTTLSDRTETANYTVTNSDDIIYCNSSTSITITMHSAASATAKMYTIKNIGTGFCTVSSSDEIDGETTQVLSQYDSISIFPRGGTTWAIH